jgi:tRNA (5-methylaminomethyl-2-thiouridylate)-methyltransferase
VRCVTRLPCGAHADHLSLARTAWRPSASLTEWRGGWVLPRRRAYGARAAGRKTVVVGMSGGVDSSVAAMLLQREGHRVLGVHMVNWDPSDEAGSRESSSCTSAEDAKSARAVCAHLGIPLTEVNLVKPYWNYVFSPSLDAFEAGLTPNPDIACNREIKFSRFLDHAVSLGADFVATGHYARLLPAAAAGSGSVARLFAGADAAKDQSYFLAGTPGAAFARVLFPLGSFTKREVRAMARDAQLPNGLDERRGSRGLCFVGKRDFPSFIAQYVAGAAAEPGDFVSADDNRTVVGAHAGVVRYTVGQKASIPGQPAKWYVVRKDPARRAVYVALGSRHPALFSRSMLLAPDFHWVAGAPPSALARMHRASAGVSAPALLESVPPHQSGPPSAPYRCFYRLRHGQPLAPCALSWSSDDARSPASLGAGSEAAARNPATNMAPNSALRLPSLRLTFDAPQRAVAPGQFVALYIPSTAFADERSAAPESACSNSARNAGSGNPDDGRYAVPGASCGAVGGAASAASSQPSAMECLGGGMIAAAGPTLQEEGVQVPPGVAL